MNTSFSKWFFSAVLVTVLSVFSFGQSNPPTIEATIIKNTVYEKLINSNPTPFIISYPDNGSATRYYVSDQQYMVEFTPDQDYTGSDQLVVEYRGEGSFPGQWPPKYITFNINIVNSVIYTTHDYGTISNDSSIELAVTENDSTSHGPLTITGFSLVTNGTASVTDSNTVVYTPEEDYVGLAYLQYLVEDTLGTKSKGNITISVIDGSSISATDTFYLKTTNQSDLDLVLPNNNFEIDTNSLPALGTAEFIAAEAVRYSPSEGAEGVDEFQLLDDEGNIRYVYVTIIDLPTPNDFVVDDVFYTEEEMSLDFDVLDNDIKRNFPIWNYTQPQAGSLIYNGSGEFTYTPPEFYSGKVSFRYTVYNGFEFEKGTVEIFINNFNPQNEIPFHIKTAKNTSIVLEYNVPIDDYEYSTFASPDFGDLNVYPGQDTVSIDCGDVSGYNLMIYNPDENFVGNDEFVLEYCIDGNNCRQVKIYVEVLDFEPDEDCACGSCVWPGDTDNDGKVSITDLLPIGLHLGNSGDARDTSEYAEWYGLPGTDWGMSQSSGGMDMKYVDSDGDGIITYDDTLALSENYHKFHNIVPTEVLSIKDYPFSLIPNSTEVDSGDLLIFEVILGNEDYPVVDMHGIAFSLNFNDELVDSSSLYWEFAENEWFGDYSPTMDMAKVPKDGTIEIGVSRTFGNPVTGDGPLGQVGFIVEDELDGFKTNGNIVNLKARLTGAYAIDELGNKFLLPDTETIVSVRLSKDNPASNDSKDLLLFPNPTSNTLNVHFNGNNIIESAEIFTLTGEKVIELGYINSNKISLSVSELETGIYFFRAITSEGAMTQKFEVFRR